MRTGGGSRNLWSTCRFFFGCWLGGLLFYWWLISKLQGQQLGAAAITGLAVALVLLALRQQAALHFKPQLRGLGILLWRLPGKIVRDLGLLTAELGRAFSPRHQATGALQEIPFAPGGQDPKSATRRALVLTGISVAPNTIAICVEPEKEALRVHQLVFRQETPTNREWPV
jgi:hypothetical protein